MRHADHLTAFQVELAGIFFALDAAEGYLVAGGAALLASDLIERPTDDLDLFAAAPVTSVAAAKEEFLDALRQRGLDVVIVRDAPTFCRMIVSAPDEETLVDLAIDSPPHDRPTITVLGPTLAPLELAGRKLLALFDRAEARDFADVYVLARQFGKDVLVEQARAIDAGLDLDVLVQMFGTLSRFDDDELPLDPRDRQPAREFFRHWTQELGQKPDH